MRKLLQVIVLCASMAVSKAQEIVYDQYAEIREVSNYDRVKITGAITVYLTQGQKPALAISSEDGKFNNKIKTEVKNGELKISIESGNWNNWNWGNKSLKAYVTVTTINELEINGASSCKITDKLNCTNLNIEINGASTLKGELASSSLTLELSGASIAEVTGTAEDLEVTASGASGYRGFQLQTQNASTSASGASTISVYAIQTLKASASGLSSIHYKGDAVIQQVNVSGGSSIRKKD